MWEEFLILVNFWTELGRIVSPPQEIHKDPDCTHNLYYNQRNRADFFGKVLGGMDEIPTPISIVCHKPTLRRDLADFWN
ncbi:hypothetical protein E2C01_034983 [Portunus trituberculatus]|uniref:Uncharacterized protein n=1 Tax=Portunus trituberculatus TaxID=210409 RepID=A0A5B7F8H7_PORTR|nr:hypothetical protein [Portunus trituberculatus]